ncbi:hypothetical protein BJ741DRAFT_172978 [Chytriomyces cf. hyalinus JEL632]|nr:hypothetical protein BJ741DRAFT_172978 [Chytriomyces cf. hyalinus JEL632]
MTFQLRISVFLNLFLFPSSTPPFLALQLLASLTHHSANHMPLPSHPIRFHPSIHPSIKVFFESCLKRVHKKNKKKNKKKI